MDADEFCPGRWGATSEEINKRYRRARAKAEFISFHGGKRACLGEKFAMLEMRTTIFEMVRVFEWVLDDDWPDRKTPVRPACLSDHGMGLAFSLSFLCPSMRESRADDDA